MRMAYHEAELHLLTWLSRLFDLNADEDSVTIMVSLIENLRCRKDHTSCFIGMIAV